MTDNTRSLRVPGASLYYCTRGSGPVLLLINGGPTDADQYAAVAARLADRYTVVTYDPRGNSRSEVDDPERDVTVDVYADDAHRLLNELSPDSPAFVFGNSGGANAAIELLIAHPDQVRTLVAHEPPLTQLLPDAAEQDARGEQIVRIYREQGVGPAMGAFMAGAGLQPPANAAPPPNMERLMRNLAFFLGHSLVPVGRYAPRIDQIASDKLVIGVGATGQSRLGYRCASALSVQTGVPLTTFPDDHAGFSGDVTAFAETLARVLQ